MTSVSKVKGFALLLSLFLFVSLQTASAEDRWFQIQEVNIHALVDTDGTMHVTETDTYEFNGVFNGILVDLDASGSDGIEDFEAYEVSDQQYIPLEYEETLDGNRIHYKIYCASEDETKVFEIHYSLKNVVQVYGDTAELYWKFFDETNQNAIGNVQIDVEFPDGAQQEEMKAFGHGPLEGAIDRVGERTVRFHASPLPAAKMFEVRLLFPEAYVPDSTKLSAEPMLERILQEEENWAYPAEEAYDPTVDYLIALALLALNLLVGAYYYNKYGKRYKPEWNRPYIRELPSDVTPAVVSYLMKFDSQTSDLIATLLDLVRKKYISVQVIKKDNRKDKDDYIFRRISPNLNGLHPHEKKLIQWLVGSKGQVSLSDIREQAGDKRSAQAFYNQWMKWQDEVLSAVHRLAYIEERPKNAKIYAWFIIAVTIQVLGLWWLIGDFDYILLCPLPLLLFRMKSELRTRIGQTEYAKWKAFKRFLNDYSRMASREPLAVHLWDHYFVYAIPLGVAKKMENIGQISMPGMNQENSALSDTFSPVFIHDWTSSFDKAISEGTPVSSSGDSGGDFTSGGGGGGGGGGRGAF